MLLEGLTGDERHDLARGPFLPRWRAEGPRGRRGLEVRGVRYPLEVVRKHGYAMALAQAEMVARPLASGDEMKRLCRRIAVYLPWIVDTLRSARAAYRRPQ